MVGNRSNRPKVISPEVISPETRVMSLEILIKSTEIILKGVCDIFRSLRDDKFLDFGLLQY